MVLLICSAVMIACGFTHRWTATTQKTKRGQTAWGIAALASWAIGAVEVVAGSLQIAGVI